MEKRQWYLDGASTSPLSIDVNSIWEDYTGKGVKIGVIDSQIDFRHGDLKGAYDTSLDYSFALGTDNPTINPRALPHVHGTAVAGIIAAGADNNMGTVGIAHGATLVGYGIDYSSANIVSQVVSALRASANVDVVNNSWSFVDNFVDNFSVSPDQESALVHAVSQGRGGLGTSIVFAAGNSGTSGSSNYHNFQNSPYTIAVGAVDKDGNPSSFTSVGANVLLSAAGRDVITTTLNDRFDSFAGTSFAAPAVSAAIGLMLEANPNLGYRDVQEILAYSARREGLSDASGMGDGWRTNGAENFNGGGLHFNDAFGYGFLNVHDAVRLAETWTTQETYANLDKITSTVALSQEMVAGSKDHISATIKVTDTISVEQVQLSLKFNWIDTGDLDIYLTSPDGTQVRLVYDLPGESRAGSINNFTFSSVASMGELSAGNWTIDIYNRNPAAADKNGVPLTAKLKGATLTLSGDGDNLKNDTYIFTDEFGVLYDGKDLAERSKLHDSDGGIDAINAAAITSNTVIDLTAARSSTIAGVALTLTANTIENVFTGDGNDIIIGSTAANLISAGRGDDVVYFSFGHDTLDGGAGNDRLVLDMAFGSYTCSVADGGTLVISSAGAVSTVSNFECFVFAGATYSFDQVMAHASGTVAVPAPPPAPTLPEQPAGTTPPSETPTEAPATPPSSGEDSSAPTPPAGDDTPRSYAHTFDGTAGADRIDGTADNDRIRGGAGDDRIQGASGHDELSGGDGVDRMFGGDGNDILLGGQGDDWLYGDNGNDWIEGGAGADKLYGGAGADTFVIDVKDLSSLDTIYDFSFAEGDRIVLTGMDEKAGTTYDFVTVFNNVYLQMHDASGTHDIVRIKGDNIGNLDAHAAEVLELWA